MANTTGDQSAPGGSGGRVDVEKELIGGSTYRGIAEQKLSPAEERFEKARRTAGFVLSPLAGIIVFLLPLDLPEVQHEVAAVLAAVIVARVTEPIPIPMSGLIGCSVLVLLGVGGADGAEGVLAPFGSGTVFTFIGAFILAQAMLQHGLARRFAFRVLSIPGVAKSSYRVVIAFGLITCLVSAWISNTATVATPMPTALGILGVIGNAVQDKHEADGTMDRFDATRMRVGFAVMPTLAYGASVGGLLTPWAARRT